MEGRKGVRGPSGGWVAAHSSPILSSQSPLDAIKRTPPSRITYLLGRLGHLHINTPMMKQQSEATPEGISPYKTITANALLVGEGPSSCTGVKMEE